MKLVIFEVNMHRKQNDKKKAKILPCYPWILIFIDKTKVIFENIKKKLNKNYDKEEYHIKQKQEFNYICVNIKYLYYYLIYFKNK